MMLMRLYYLQHVPFENPGCILDWAQRNRVDVKGAHLYKNEPLPALEDFDLLVVMGGAMGANDDDHYPWMRPEKELLDRAIAADKKVIGICLGSQFLADVLGVRVYPNAHKEIGWFPTTWSEAAQSHDLTNHMPETLEVFHWHGDTYDLPQGAIHLAESAACRNQAFLYGDHVLAFQFHLEVKEENVRAMLAHCGEELVDARYIQARQEILRGMVHCGGVNEKIYELLDKFCRGCFSVTIA
jgi:GMP synthase (glutamine-hydrolysing)